MRRGSVTVQRFLRAQAFADAAPRSPSSAILAPAPRHHGRTERYHAKAGHDCVFYTSVRATDARKRAHSLHRGWSSSAVERAPAGGHVASGATGSHRHDGTVSIGVLKVYRARIVPPAEAAREADAPVVSPEALESEAGRQALWDGVGDAPVRVFVPRASVAGLASMGSLDAGIGGSPLSLSGPGGVQPVAALGAGDEGPGRGSSNGNGTSSQSTDAVTVTNAGADGGPTALAALDEAMVGALPLGSLLSARATEHARVLGSRLAPVLPGTGAGAADMLADDTRRTRTHGGHEANSDVSDPHRAGDAPAGAGEGVAERLIAQRWLSPLERQLLSAAELGDVTRIAGLLETGDASDLDIHAPHPAHGGTALHMAAACVNEALALPTVRMLIAAGADIHRPAGNGSTPLHWAAGAGHEDVVRHLLEEGGDPAATTYTWRRQTFGKDSGQTPAHWAAGSNHMGVVRMLAAAAADTVAALDERGDTPRSVAKREGHDDVAVWLQEREETEYVLVELGLAHVASRVL